MPPLGCHPYFTGPFFVPCQSSPRSPDRPPPPAPPSLKLSPERYRCTGLACRASDQHERKRGSASRFTVHMSPPLACERIGYLRPHLAASLCMPLSLFPCGVCANHPPPPSSLLFLYTRTYSDEAYHEVGDHDHAEAQHRQIEHRQSQADHRRPLPHVRGTVGEEAGHRGRARGPPGRGQGGGQQGGPIPLARHHLRGGGAARTRGWGRGPVHHIRTFSMYIPIFRCVSICTISADPPPTDPLTASVWCLWLRLGNHL